MRPITQAPILLVDLHTRQVQEAHKIGPSRRQWMVCLSCWRLRWCLQVEDDGPCCVCPGAYVMTAVGPDTAAALEASWLFGGMPAVVDLWERGPARRWVETL